MASNEAGLGGVVAKHYDNLPEKGKEQRKDSRIYHMRNFNNWIKSTLINEYMDKIKTSQVDDYRCKVLDIACGKGGDLLKWQRCGVGHVVGVDIAATSIEQCKERFADMRGKARGKLFSGEFYAADCTKDKIRELYKNPEIQFDLVSCQFAFHYCFESLPQAECMLENISQNLKKGGYFVGTTPCSYDIIARLRKSGGHSFGNSVFSVTFPESKEEEKTSPLPLFGAQYTFHLEEVVDCPEFLVHFPTFVKLAEKYGLMMVGKERFRNYFQKRVKGEENKKLLNRMNALESYPSQRLVGGEDQYDEAQEYLQSNGVDKFGTLSRDEWEALTIYVVFAFKKIR